MDILKIFNLPVNASSHGHEVDMIIFLVHIVMMILFIGWGIFFIVALFKFRKKKNPTASYTGVTSHYTTWIEAAIIVIEIVLLVGVFYSVLGQASQCLSKKN